MLYSLQIVEGAFNKGGHTSGSICDPVINGYPSGMPSSLTTVPKAHPQGSLSPCHSEATPKNLSRYLPYGVKGGGVENASGSPFTGTLSELYGSWLLLIATFLTITFSGCASPYGPLGPMGGYTDTKIQEGLYKIEFKGNGYTSDSKASEFVLLRAAELALQNGYKFFVIIDERNSAKISAFSTPGTSQTIGNAQVIGGPTYYTGTYSGTTYYNPGQTYIITRPIDGITIQCFVGRPININALVYDAQQVARNIRSKYGMSVSTIQAGG